MATIDPTRTPPDVPSEVIVLTSVAAGEPGKIVVFNELHPSHPYAVKLRKRPGKPAAWYPAQGLVLQATVDQALRTGHVLVIAERGFLTKTDTEVLAEVRHPRTCRVRTCAIGLEVSTRFGELRLPSQKGAYGLALVEEPHALPRVDCFELLEGARP